MMTDTAYREYSEFAYDTANTDTVGHTVVPASTSDEVPTTGEAIFYSFLLALCIFGLIATVHSIVADLSP